MPYPYVFRGRRHGRGEGLSPFTAESAEFTKRINPIRRGLGRAFLHPVRPDLYVRTLARTRGLRHPQVSGFNKDRRGGGPPYLRVMATICRAFEGADQETS